MMSAVDYTVRAYQLGVGDGVEEETDCPKRESDSEEEEYGRLWAVGSLHMANGIYGRRSPMAIEQACSRLAVVSL